MQEIVDKYKSTPQKNYGAYLGRSDMERGNHNVQEYLLIIQHIEKQISLNSMKLWGCYL